MKMMLMGMHLDFSADYFLFEHNLNLHTLCANGWGEKCPKECREDHQKIKNCADFGFFVIQKLISESVQKSVQNGCANAHSCTPPYLIDYLRSEDICLTPPKKKICLVDPSDQHRANAQPDMFGGELNKPPRCDKGFLEFKKTYPKKRNWDRAEKAWRKNKCALLADYILTDVKTRIAHDERWKAGFIPDPATYINGKRWEDELADPCTNQQGRVNGHKTKFERSRDKLRDWAERNGLSAGGVAPVR